MSVNVPPRSTQNCQRSPTTRTHYVPRADMDCHLPYHQAAISTSRPPIAPPGAHGGDERSKRMELDVLIDLEGHSGDRRVGIRQGARPTVSALPKNGTAHL